MAQPLLAQSPLAQPPLAQSPMAQPSSDLSTKEREELELLRNQNKALKEIISNFMSSTREMLVKEQVDENGQKSKVNKRFEELTIGDMMKIHW